MTSVDKRCAMINIFKVSLEENAALSCGSAGENGESCPQGPTETCRAPERKDAVNAEAVLEGPSTSSLHK